MDNVIGKVILFPLLYIHGLKLKLHKPKIVLINIEIAICYETTFCKFEFAMEIV
jgi:hypothetical protein